MQLNPDIEAQLGQIYGINTAEPALATDTEEKLKQIYGVQSEPANNNQPQSPSLIDKFNQPLTDIANQTSKIFNNASSQSPASTALQLIGQGASVASLPATMAASAISSAIPQGVKDYVSDSAVGDVARQYGSKISEVTQANPEMSANIGAGVNIAGTLIGGKIATPVVEKSITAATPVVNRAMDALKPVAKAPKKTIDDVVTAAGNAYKSLDTTGTGFSNAFTDKAVSALESAKFKPIAGQTLLPAEAVINRYLDNFLDLKGKPITLGEFQRIDSELGDAASQAWVTGKNNEGRIISEAQDRIRDMVKPENLKAQDIVGSPDSINTLMNDAIPLWSAKSKMQDIQKIIERANSMDNPTTAMRTGFRNLSMSKKFKTYPMEVQKLIVKARDSGKVDDILGIVGSRLNPIAGAAAGGLQGAIVSQATSMASRGARNYFKNRQADKIIEALINPVSKSVDNFSDEAVKGGLQVRNVVQRVQRSKLAEADAAGYQYNKENRK